jgi:putative hydrolase of the HAD superfamily
MSEKVIVFDLGKVIFDYDLDIAARALCSHSSKVSSFNSVVDFMTKNEKVLSDYEKGFISSTEFYDSIVGLLGLKNISFEKFSYIFNNIFTPNEDIIDFIQLLSQKYELAILSNTNQLHFDYLYNKYKEAFLCFKNMHLSYLMNARKPEKEIYEQVISLHNTSAENIFFTDDNDENVYSAMICGIKAFSFKNISKLKQDLMSFGIEI